MKRCLAVPGGSAVMPHALGKLALDYRREGDAVHWHITIPRGMQARLCIGHVNKWLDEGENVFSTPYEEVCA